MHIHAQPSTLSPEQKTDQVQRLLKGFWSRERKGELLLLEQAGKGASALSTPLISQQFCRNSFYDNYFFLCNSTPNPVILCNICTSRPLHPRLYNWAMRMLRFQAGALYCCSAVFSCLSAPFLYSAESSVFPTDKSVLPQWPVINCPSVDCL